MKLFFGVFLLYEQVILKALSDSVELGVVTLSSPWVAFDFFGLLVFDSLKVFFKEAKSS
jgi:hypothetical protein